MRIAAELNGAGNIQSEFIYSEKANVPEYLKRGADLFKVITNQLGSVVAVVNASTGSVAQEIKYDEFGNVTSDTNPGFQPFGFAGGLYDPRTKLVHFNAREYDGETGRWLSKDPIRFSGGDTNLYGYVLNDPINLVDRDGKSWGWTAAAAGIGLALYGLNKFFFNPDKNKDDGFKNWLDRSYDSNQGDFWDTSYHPPQNFTPRTPNRMPSSEPSPQACR